MAAAYAVSQSTCIPGAYACTGIYYPLEPLGIWDYFSLSSNAVPSLDCMYPSAFSCFPFSPRLCRTPLPLHVYPEFEFNDVFTTTIRDPYGGGTMELGNFRFGRVAQMPEPGQSGIAFLYPEEDSSGGWGRGVMTFISSTVASTAWPTGTRHTAAFGYTAGYFRGNRFHEGHDTSWRSLVNRDGVCIPCIRTQGAVCFPINVVGGSAYVLCPLFMADEVWDTSLDMNSRLELAIHHFDLFFDPAVDLEDTKEYALVIGGIHVASEVPGTKIYRAASLYHSTGACRRGDRWLLPYECDASLVIWPGEAFAMCGVTPGYAGASTPHCHWQTAILTRGEAIALVNEFRKSAPTFIHSPTTLENTSICAARQCHWGLYSHFVHRMVDPALVFWGGALLGGDTASLPESWAGHSWPPGSYGSAEYFTPTTDWTGDDLPDYHPGIHDTTNSAYENHGGECQIYDKRVPGIHCRPSSRGTIPDAFNSVISSRSSVLMREYWNEIRNAFGNIWARSE